MFTRNRFLKLALCLSLLAVLASSSFALTITKQLADGVTLYQEIITTSGAEQIINLVTVDPKVAGVEVKAAIGRDVILNDEPAKGCETIGALAERHGALVGINADFFPMGSSSAGDPLGVCIIDGELISEPSSKRAVAAILNDGTCVFDNPVLKASLTLKNGVSRQIDGINRNRETNQVIAYTKIFYPTTRSQYKGTEVICTSEDLPVRCGRDIKLTVVEVREESVSSPIPENGMVLSAGGPAAHFLKSNLKAGDTFTVRFDISSIYDVDWTQVRQAVGGRPWILKDGKEYISLEYEGIGASFSTTRHPRSAIGRSADGKTMLITVDGRQDISRGVSLPELSAIMRRLGAVDAINLDGGGSTTLVYRGGVLNSPSDGTMRVVANGLLVFAKQPPNDEISNLSILVPNQKLSVGKGMQLYLTQGDEKYPLAQNQIDTIIWATSNGIGFINQYGYLIPYRVHKGPIMAFYGDQKVTIDVDVTSPASN